MSNPNQPAKSTFQAFKLLEPMTDTPDHVLDVVRPFIAKSLWIYARTMPEHPHEYVLRRNSYIDGREEEFVNFAELIRQYGYTGRFYRKKLVYLNVDQHRYWSMGNPIRRYPAPPAFDTRGRPDWPETETTLINRARNDDLALFCCQLSQATGGKHHAKTCHNFRQAA
jgi:hypothetical protein